MPMHVFFGNIQIKIEGQANGQIFAQLLRVLRSGIYRRVRLSMFRKNVSPPSSGQIIRPARNQREASSE
jgi:hypothetical protein